MSTEIARAHTYAESRLLYVVLQGEFALYHEKMYGAAHDRLWIMAPDVPEHQYLAGPWGTQWCKAPPLPSHRLCLRHVHGEVNSEKEHCGRATPESNPDIFMKLGKETRHDEGARIVITAPMPLAILPGRLESTSTVVITVTNDDGTTTCPPVPSNPTVIPILVYKWYEGHRPDLWDEHDQCSLFSSGGPSDQFQNIQIYATSLSGEGGPDGKKHAQDAFTAAAKLLGVCATIDWEDHQFELEFATPPPGLAWVQVNRFLFEILGMTQDQLDSDAPVSQYTPRFGSSGNCGPITG